MARRDNRENNAEPKSRFGLGKKEWLFVNGSLTLNLWFFSPREGEISGSIYGQTFPTTTVVLKGLTLVTVSGIDPTLTPRLEASCTSQISDVLTCSQEIPVEQPSNSEQVDVKFYDFKDGDTLCLEVAARVLSLAGRVLPPVPVKFALGSDARDAIATDAKGVATTIFRNLEYSRTYVLLVATLSSGERSSTITIKPARSVAYDIRETVVPVEGGQPKEFTLQINVWDDVKVVPLSGLQVNAYANGVPKSAKTNEQGVAELTFPFDVDHEQTSYRVLVEDGKEKKSSVRRPAIR